MSTLVGAAAPDHRCDTIVGMLVGIPTEVKEDESRVAITPSGVAAFVTHGHDVVIQQDAVAEPVAPSGTRPIAGPEGRSSTRPRRSGAVPA